MYPADCLGDDSHKELRARQLAFSTPDYELWDGCNAGVRGFGLLHNDEILGCTSIRSREYVEGSLRERPLAEIWNDSRAFTWRRGMTKEKLSGHCAACKYGGKCLGGCPNTRLTMNGNIYGENQYCSYNVALKRSAAKIKQQTNAADLLKAAQQSAKDGEFQLAAQQLERVLELDAATPEAARLQGYAEFMLGNYAASETANRRAIAAAHDDAYAKKGLGVALFRQGKREEGLRLVEEAAKTGDPDAQGDLDALYREVKGKR
jgi:radical SAM protein with 4Fe4S-binding SPASM domain